MFIREFNTKLELQNEGQLSLFFIGAGSAFSKKYYNTNLLIVKGNDHVLMDCGSLCPFALETLYNTKIYEIKNLFLTHPHADHIGGVEEFMLASKYIKHEKINLAITDEFKKKLWNQSLRGGCQYSEKGKMYFSDYFNQLKPLRIQKKPFEIYEIQMGTINLKIFRTMHITTKKDSIRNSQISYGVLVDNKVLLTGDSQFRKEQLEFFMENFPEIQGIFHDCDISGYSPNVHASYEQLNSLEDSIKNKMYLCHYNSKISGLDLSADGFAGYAKPGIYYDFE